MLRIALLLLQVALVSLMSLTVGTVVKAAHLWLRFRPWKRLRNGIRRWRTRKERASWVEEHGGPPDEVREDFNSTDEVRPMALDFGTRTSTNAGVAGLAVVWLCQLTEQFLPGLLGANADDYLIVAVAWLVARFSKTPDSPGKL